MDRQRPSDTELTAVAVDLAREVGTVLNRSVNAVMPWAIEFAASGLLWKQEAAAAKASGDAVAQRRCEENLRQLEYLGILALGRAGVQTQGAVEGAVRTAIRLALVLK